MSTDWTFGGTWPYEPRFHRTAEGRMHYVSVGPQAGHPVVLLHGNPTWGYLYRRIIPPLAERGHRAIAVDHLGFGRSDKPEDTGACAIARHARRMAGFLDTMRLERACFVIHDWGGPIALPWIADHPERVAGVFVLNTFAPRLPGPMGARGSIRAFRTPGLGSWLVKRRAVPLERFLFDAGMARPERLDERARRAYRAPFPTPAGREPMLAFPREIPRRDSDPVAELTRRTAARLQERLAETPVSVCWGTEDVLFGEDVLALWLELWPHADVSRVPDAGHFVQEDAPDEVAERLLAFLGSTRPGGVERDR